MSLYHLFMQDCDGQDHEVIIYGVQNITDTLDECDVSALALLWHGLEA